MTNSGSVGTSINLKYPRYEFRYARRFADGLQEAAECTEYSASFDLSGIQDYDLQSIISSSAAAGRTDQSSGHTQSILALLKTRKF